MLQKGDDGMDEMVTLDILYTLIQFFFFFFFFSALILLLALILFEIRPSREILGILELLTLHEL